MLLGSMPGNLEIMPGVFALMPGASGVMPGDFAPLPGTLSVMMMPLEARIRKGLVVDGPQAGAVPPGGGHTDRR